MTKFYVLGYNGQRLPTVLTECSRRVPKPEGTPTFARTCPRRSRCGKPQPIMSAALGTIPLWERVTEHETLHRTEHETPAGELRHRQRL